MTASPVDPNPMPRWAKVAYAVGSPLLLIVLLFVPAGSIGWVPGWLFLIVLLAAFAVSTAAIGRFNPVVFRARSRIQPGTKSWDRKLLGFMIAAMMAVLPVAALDAGRFGHPPSVWVTVAGYAVLLAGFAIMTWAQCVNAFFEPGVRIQHERHQRVIDTGPYAVVRHPGYVGAILLFAGMALALGSVWALVPAVLASSILVVRTGWEDRLLRAELGGYETYASRTRWRLAPGLW